MSDRPERIHISESELSREMRSSFLDYAMSVIVSRALPDVRDGMKPVHRRILYGMNELGITPDKPHKKSARIVGDVMGKYHPHGDSAIYQSMVRMAQDFSYRYTLVAGHGNFGSVDGDGAAAMRYTEARLSKLAMEMLRDLNKDTVDLQDNYDGNEREPSVLPARFPNLLVNGASGIAVGMATNIPPHNLTETINATRYLMRNPEATTLELMDYLPAPDFPTGGILLGKSGVVKAYETGRGSITIRAKARIEEDSRGKETIIVDEIPYMVNKAQMIQKIAELAREREIDGITELRDESDQKGMRIVIGVRRDASAGVILNNLYKMTQMQTSFGINNVAIVDGVPRTLSLKEILSEYIKHQKEVITRRTRYEKQKAEDWAHILEGLRIALDNIDEIIHIIRSSRETATAKEQLMSRFELSDKQAQSILDMRLARLTGLEREKIENEFQELIATIADLADILAKPERIVQIIDDEMTDIADRYGDERRTELQIGDALSIEDEDLIEREDITILVTDNGYVKRMNSAEFRPQHRGGRGIKAMTTADGDHIPLLLSCSTHDMISFFTNEGKVYRCKAYEIPEFGRNSKGIPLVNIIELDKDEKVEAMLPLGDVPQEGEQVFFVTKQGLVKRTAAEEFKNIRTNGLIAINLKDDDELIDVFMTTGQDQILLASRQGYAVHFEEDQVRSMGRTATGVRGINLRSGDEVIGGSVVPSDADVLVVTENGYGKRTPIADYPIRQRGGKGVKTVNITDKNGPLVAILAVRDDDEIMIINSDEIMIRFAIDDVSQTGRATMGVRLVRMDPGTVVTTADVVSLKESMDKDDLADDNNQTTDLMNPEVADFDDDIQASTVEDVIDNAEDE